MLIFVLILKQEELEVLKLERQCYVPQHQLKNPDKPGKVIRVRNTASKFKLGGTSLNDNFLTGPDLLLILIEIILGKQKIAKPVTLRRCFHESKCLPEDCEMLRFLE